MKHWKIISLLIVVGLIIGGVFAYIYFSKSQNPMTNVQSNSNIQNPNTETADWKTYRNNEYGFEFKYPKEWAIAEERGEDYFLVLIGKQEPIEVSGIFAFSVRQKTEEEYLNSLKSARFYITSKSNTVVDNKNAIFYTLKRTDAPLEMQWRSIVIAKYNAIVEFSMGATEEHDNIFYQTLSTFKFTK